MRWIPTSLVLACALAAAAEAQVRAVFLLDRSGSMGTGAPSRAFRAQDQCFQDILEFLSVNPGSEFSVREFNSSLPAGSQWIGPAQWLNNPGQGFAAVNSAMDTGGFSSIADAICDARSTLLAAVGTTKSFVYMYTDGAENFASTICGGGNATNALTGRCSFDDLTPGADFQAAVGGGASWQQNSSQAFDLVRNLRGASLNAYLFSDFTFPLGNAGFQFLRSCVRGSGGFSAEYQDGYTAAMRLWGEPDTACSSGSIPMPALETTGIAALGSFYGVNVMVPPGYSSWISFSGLAYPAPIDLGLLNAPGCALGLEPQVSYNATGVGIPVPNDPTLPGFVLHAQGFAFSDTIPALQTGWMLTSPMITTEVVLMEPAVPPSVTITSPAADVPLGDFDFVWDGFDVALGRWYKDVCLSASVTDDDPVPASQVVWTTSQILAQPAHLGTGTNPCVRFYSTASGATGTTHVVTVTVTDAEGLTATAQRSITFWTLI